MCIQNIDRVQDYPEFGAFIVGLTKYPLGIRITVV